MSILNKSRREWLEALSATGSTRFDVAACEAVVAETGRSCIPLWFRANSCDFKVSRGQWDITSFVNGTSAGRRAAPSPRVDAVATPAPAPAPAPATPVMQMAGAESRIIPDKMPEYVKWGHHSDVERILRSGEFYPIYVTGLSGNGKPR